MADLPTVTVTGTLCNPDQTRFNGSIRFLMPVMLRHADGTAVAPASFSHEVVDGEIEVDLLYVDAPGWGPEDWAWEVTIPRGSVKKVYGLAPSVDDGSVNFGDLLIADYQPVLGNDYALLNHDHADLADAIHTHLDLATDVELANGLSGKANSSHMHTAGNVTDLAATVSTLVTAAIRAADERNVTAGEYVLRRKDANSTGPVLSGSIYLTHFKALKTETIQTVQTYTQSGVAVGGTHAWNGFMTWTGTQYLPGWVSADEPSRWSVSFTEYNTPIYAVSPGTGLANLSQPGFQKVAGQDYAYWKIWTGSGTAPSLPAAFWNNGDALVSPREAGFMALTAPPSSAIEAAWLTGLGRGYNGWMRP